ncbi:MAG: SpoVG family protein [Pirellulales bacterium]|nr:SpoVG family protein [Pirellulales bacterium]MBX3432161.1 SpoVG family protein [Pirellulales bacterium]
MQVTEVRIKLMDEPGERLKAFCSITFDNCFVVRDLKIIEGSSGPFVAMPSRKLTAHCPSCHAKNHLRAPYCSQCGRQLSLEHMPTDADGRAKLYADIAHPINSACREMIQEHVIREYETELIRAKEPGYVSRYDDFDIDYGEARRPPREADRSAEKRTDAAHDRRGPHAPRGGGPAETPVSRPAPAPAPHLSQGFGNINEGFGAGIFPDDRS